MIDFNDHGKVLSLLKEAQDYDHYNRERARKSHSFVHDVDGQWEPEVISKMIGRPRYTFDMVTPIIDQACSTFNKSDLAVNVKAAASDTSKDQAEITSSIINSINNKSGSKPVYRCAFREMLISGISGWRVVNDWASEKSFNQDILIKNITNFIDRVWFSPKSDDPTSNDSNYAFVMSDITRNEYKSRFGDEAPSGISSDRSYSTKCSNSDKVSIGEALYKKSSSVTLALMSNGEVYEINDDFKRIQDELTSSGVTISRTRKSTSVKVYSRFFDNNRWLSDESLLPFSYIPVVSIYGNYEVSQGSRGYRGITEKLMDAQRVLNYAKSREIEEGALAPRAKYWMTREQAKSDTRTLATMNTNANPIQTYTHIDGQPQPYLAGGAQINPGIAKTSEDAANIINKSAGIFSSNLGDNPLSQSGVAIETQIEQGNSGLSKYFEAMEQSLSQTAKTIVSGIPKVYDSNREITVEGLDGTVNTFAINRKILDEQTGEQVIINDLSKGEFNVVAKIGKSFGSKRGETVQSILEIAAIKPEILDISSDILLRNIDSPGVDEIAERVRSGMVSSGVIPQSQFTEEELEAAQAAASQAQEPSPADVIALAEAEKAQAQTADIISKIKEREQKAELEEAKLLKEIAGASVNELSEYANILKTLKEVIGADQVITPELIKSFANQIDLVTESQEVISSE